MMRTWVSEGPGHSGDTRKRRIRAWGRRAYLRALRQVEPLEQRAFLDASPFGLVSYTPLTGRPVIAAGPGGVDEPLVDLNNDGLGDMIVSYYNGDSPGTSTRAFVSALLTNADGSTREYFIANYTVPALTSADVIENVLVADVNHDGNPDVVVQWNEGGAASNTANARHFDVFLGYADGTFTKPGATINHGTTITSPKTQILDITGDGHKDLFVQGTDVSFTVYRGNGDGTFAAAKTTAFNILTLSATTNVVPTYDLSGDGVLDLAISGRNAFAEQVLFVFKGQTDGTFNVTPAFSDTSHSLTLMSVRHMNSDNHYDMVAFSGSLLGNGSGSAYIFRNQGNGTFTEVFHSSTYASGLLQQPVGGVATQPFLTGRFNNDSIDDLVLLEGSILSSTLKIHIIKSAGAGFTQAQTITVDNFAASSAKVQVFDMDNDGFDDIFVPQMLNGSQRATVLFNLTTNVNAAGLTDPGVLVLPDIVPSQFPRVADFTGDGILDIVFTGVSQNTSTNVVQIFPGNASKSFDAGVVTVVPTRINLHVTSQPPTNDPLVDFTGDGRADIIVYGNVATDVVADGVSILSGNSDGSMTLLEPRLLKDFQVVHADQVPLVVDLNDDGKLDLMFTGKKISSPRTGLFVLVNGVNEPTDTAGSTKETALDLGTLTSAVSLTEFVNPSDAGSTRDGPDWFKFTLDSSAFLRFTATGDVSPVTLDLRDSNGIGIGTGFLSPAILERQLDAGTYYVDIRLGAGPSTKYKLDIAFPGTSSAFALYQGFAPVADQADVSFGSVYRTTTDTHKTYTIRNDGAGTLTLGAITFPTGFTLGENTLVSALGPGEADSFDIIMLTATNGTFSGEMQIPSSAGTFTLNLSGVVSGPPEPIGPIVGVSSGGNAITSGQLNAISFGSVQRGGTAAQVIFTVTNSGDQILTLGTPVLPAGYAIVEGLSTSLNAGQSDTFTVRLNTTAVGDFSGNITFTHNSSGSPFAIPVSGAISPGPNDPPNPSFPPDLTAEITSMLFANRTISEDDFLIPGDKITVKLRVNNEGTGAASASNVKVAFSVVDPFLAVEPVAFPVANISKLKVAPGGFADLTFTLTLPGTIRAGDLQLAATVDSTNVVVESDEENNEAVSADTLPVVLRAGTVGTRKNVKLVFTQANGTQVTITATQGVTVSVTPDDLENRLALDITQGHSKGVVTVTSKAVQGSNPVLQLSEVNIDSTIASFVAATADLAGAFTATGGLGTLKVRDLAGATVNIGTPTANGSTATITLQKVTDSTITSEIPIKSLTAYGWFDTDSFADSLTTVGITTLKITGNKPRSIAGNFEADVTGNGAPTLLGTASIAGSLMGSTWTLNGTTGAITVTGAAGSDVAPVSIFAQAIKSLTINGSSQALTLGLTLDYDPLKPKVLAMGSLVIKGRTDTLLLTSTGSVGTISTGALSSSGIFVGLDSGFTTLPISELDFVASGSVGASITTITINGSMSGSSIAATTITTAKLPAAIATDNAFTPFGLAARAIKSASKGAAKFPDADKNGSVDPAVNGDFEIRVI